MKNTKKNNHSQTMIVRALFTYINIIKISGFNTVAQYMNKQSIVHMISSPFLHLEQSHHVRCQLGIAGNNPILNKWNQTDML